MSKFKKGDIVIVQNAILIPQNNFFNPNYVVNGFTMRQGRKRYNVTNLITSLNFVFNEEDLVLDTSKPFLNNFKEYFIKNNV